MEDNDRAREIEETARNIDRLVTVGAGLSGAPNRWIIPALYESASRKLEGRPISQVAAQALINTVGKGDRVILVTGFAYQPNMPNGETDGPPGVASLARALRVGLGALPVLVSGPRDIGVARQTTKAAGVNVLDYDSAIHYKSSVAGEFTFPITDEGESKQVAASILDKVSPKAIITVETLGPNRKGVKHSGAGYDVAAEDKIAQLEHLFLQSRERRILSIGMMDRGNEMGSGAIEEDVRRITPYANVCRCPCGDGNACAVKTDIIFPAFISNWGAYAVSAMLAYLLRKPDALQDDDTERRMLEACATAGAVDGNSGRPEVSADGVGLKGQQGLINLLHTIVENGLKGS